MKNSMWKTEQKMEESIVWFEFQSSIQNLLAILTNKERMLKSSHFMPHQQAESCKL